MTKVLPIKKAILSFLNIEAIFFTEAHAYNTVLPALGDFAPKSLMADKERIMMEDLREQGYAVAERRNFLDLDHVSLVLKTLATMHARSLALKLTNPEAFKVLVAPLKELIYPEECEESISAFMENGQTLTLKCFEKAEPQTEDIKKILAHFERYRNKFFPEMQKLFAGTEPDNYVVCHGDPWTNNLMFKHGKGKDGEEGKIVGLKLVDFQILRYQSPAVDFHYHVYSSANNDVINNHYDDLISLYHGTFIEELKRKNIPESKWRPFDVVWFKGELKKYALFGVVSGFCLAHAHLAEEDQIREMNEMSPEDFKEMEAWSIASKPQFMQRISYLALNFIRNFD